MIGVDDSDGLVERLFREMGPDERMLDAVRRARDAGVPTGLISNSWGSDRPTTRSCSTSCSTRS